MRRIGLAVALIMIAVPVAAQSNDLPPVDANEQREIAQQILTELGYQNGTFDSPANGASDASSTPSDSAGNSNTSGQSTSDSSGQATSGGSADNTDNTASSNPPPSQTPPPAQSPDGETASAGARVLQILGIAVVIVALGALIWHLVGQRVAEAERSPKKTKKALPDRHLPKDLEQVADNAAAAGDYEGAIRIRFQAGLIRLEKAGVLEYQEQLTSGHVAGLLHNDQFDGIAESFDAVAYGARTANADDYQHAAQTWPIVISEAGKR